MAESAAHVTLSEAKGLAGDLWGMPPGEILRSLRSLRMTGGLVMLAGAAHGYGIHGHLHDLRVRVLD